MALTEVVLPEEDEPQPLIIEIGGPHDEWAWFPSTVSARARDHYEETGEALRIHTFGHEVIEFIEYHCVLTDSHYAGQPFDLMDWQKRLLLEMYEVELGADGSWQRKHRWGLIGIPKKNGKTELAAALGVYHIFDDEPAPNVICAAASDDQAKLVGEAAKRICDWSETLNAVTIRKEKKIEVIGKPGSQLLRVAAVAGTNDGKNVYVTIIDELHEWIANKARSVFTVLTQGGGARRQPLNIMITTAGFEQDSLCYEFYTAGQAIIDGEVEDPSFYFCWFEADEEGSHLDPEQWKKANPSWGLILKEEFYRDMVTKRSESEFRRYFMNQWTEAEEIWEAAALWDDCLGTPMIDPGRKTFVGIDIGRKNDTTAVVVCQWDEKNGGLQVTQRIWQNPFPIRSKQRAQWRLNFASVENYLRDLYDEFPERTLPGEEDEEDDPPLPGPAFMFDPHLFSRTAQNLAADGLNMIEFPQTDARMVPASQRLFELIKGSELVHDENSVARKHIRSVVAKERERGWRIDKLGSGKHIDFAVAMSMAAYICTENKELYEELVIH